MKIRILKPVTMREMGIMADLKINSIIALEDSLAEKLVEEGKAELVLD